MKKEVFRQLEWVKADKKLSDLIRGWITSKAVWDSSWKKCLNLDFSRSRNRQVIWEVIPGSSVENEQEYTGEGRERAKAC